MGRKWFTQLGCDRTALVTPNFLEPNEVCTQETIEVNREMVSSDPRFKVPDIVRIIDTSLGTIVSILYDQLCLKKLDGCVFDHN